MISITATIYGTESDCIGSDNVFTSTQEAVGAIDPNDIIVSPEGFIDAGQELIYKIRFQNVGNRAVSTVRIEDDLPSYLDLNSFQQGTASHPFSLSLRDQKLIWTFDNINMPDSTANEPESHGFVIFKIKTKPNLNDKIKIENTAAIYFDANAPVITNTVVNIIGSPANSPNEEGTIRVSPNPMSKESVVEIIPFGQATMNIQSVVVYDLFGRIVLEQQGLDQKYFQLQKEGMAAGTYLIRIIGENGDQFLGRVIMVEGLD